MRMNFFFSTAGEYLGEDRVSVERTEIYAPYLAWKIRL